MMRWTVGLALCLALGACQEGLDLSGRSIEGFDTFGNRGGTMYTPDGNFTFEVDDGAIAREVDLTVGALDDCIDGELACYELEPRGLLLDRPATVTFDVANLMAAEFTEDPDAPHWQVWAFVREPRGWRPIASGPGHEGTLMFALDRLAPITIVADLVEG